MLWFISFMSCWIMYLFDGSWACLIFLFARYNLQISASISSVMCTKVRPCLRWLLVEFKYIVVSGQAVFIYYSYHYCSSKEKKISLYWGRPNIACMYIWARPNILGDFLTSLPSISFPSCFGETFSECFCVFGNLCNAFVIITRPISGSILRTFLMFVLKPMLWETFSTSRP